MAFKLSCHDIELKPQYLQQPISIKDSNSLYIVDFKDHIKNLPVLQASLSTEENLRAGRFHALADKQKYILTRGILRRLLSELLTCEAAEVVISSGMYQKPQLHNDYSIQFNVSHTSNMATIAFSANPIGVDLELINRNFDYKSVLESACSYDEARILETSACPLHDFFRFWTRKEAFLKGIGTGLTSKIQQISVTNGNHSIDSADVNSDWIVGSSQLSFDYIISVATPVFPAVVVPIQTFHYRA